MPGNQWQLSDSGGFSIIEIIIVLAIGAIMLTGAVISYRATLPDSRLRQATTELYGALNLARVSALSQSATMTLQLAGASSSIAGANVTVTGTAGTPITMSVTSSAGGTLITGQPLTTEVVSITVSPGTGSPVQPRVQFNSYGLHVGGGTQIVTLTNTMGRVYSINVAAGGKAKWCLAPACP
jgi:type IV fimbrial biogenesis protein FimT